MLEVATELTYTGNCLRCKAKLLKKCFELKINKFEICTSELEKMDEGITTEKSRHMGLVFDMNLCEKCYESVGIFLTPANVR